MRTRPSTPVRGSSILAVCAHPDDESFALGAVLHHLATKGVKTALLCFSRGGASTLGGESAALDETRANELKAAAREVGIAHVELLDYPDGALASVPLAELARAVDQAVGAVGADLLLVFDKGGVTGHLDHCRATEAALVGAPEVPLLGWNVPTAVGDILNAEFGTSFVGQPAGEFDLVLTVDREAQLRAIACHASQSTDNPVLWRRLELLGNTEWLRWLRRPAAASIRRRIRNCGATRPTMTRGGLR